MEHDSESPEIVSAEDLLGKLRAGVKEVHEISMRGLTIPVRILSCDEVNRIRREAIRQSSIVQGDETDKNLEIQKTTLKLASTISKGGGPFLSDKILSLLTVDELGYLFEEYVSVMERMNPSIENISSDQFKALVDALKKNTVSARDLSLRQLKAICTAYADLIQRQETVT